VATPLKSLLATLILMCYVGPAAAAYVQLGEIALTGTFTLNSAFDFNNQTAQPFGTFSAMTISQATGMLAPFAPSGASLTMNTASLFVQPSDHPIVWSVGGYSVDTTLALVTGASFVGNKVSGHFVVRGYGVDTSVLGGPGAFGGSFGFWEFTAPPFDVSGGIPAITGPITLRIVIAFDDGAPVLPVVGFAVTAPSALTRPLRPCRAARSSVSASEPHPSSASILSSRIALTRLGHPLEWYAASQASSSEVCTRIAR